MAKRSVGTSLATPSASRSVKQMFKPACLMADDEIAFRARFVTPKLMAKVYGATWQRSVRQLRDAGIAHTPMPDVARLRGTRPAVELLGTDAPYGLLVPGAAPHRPAKRWPAEYFGEVARAWADRGLLPVILGTAGEKPLADAIRAVAPSALDMTGATSLNDIVTLALGARAAAGNDTGPMHLVSLAGTPSVALFGSDSDPALCAPRGASVSVLQAPEISAITPEAVNAALGPCVGISEAEA